MNLKRVFRNIWSYALLLKLISNKQTFLNCTIYIITVMCTLTSRLFTHIVSTEKVRKDMRDRKDTRGT